MSETNMENQFDIIIIGSGMGSLTTGSFMSKYYNKKVLIIEKHFQPGGFTHSFSRKQAKYSWDVGIHYIGDMHEGGFCRQLMDKITDSKVKWNKMPEPFEKFVFPTRTFELYGDEQKFKQDLINLYTDEKDSIEKYFSDIKKVSAQFGKSMMIKLSSPSIDAFENLIGKNIYTLKEYLDLNFKNIELKAIIASQWGDYGLPPSKVSFATHAALVVHYFKGGYYPIGGAGKIFDSIEPIIHQNGGKVLSSTEAIEIIIEENKAIGVKTKAIRGEKLEVNYYAPIVVSGTGAYITYNRLISKNINIPFREDLLKFYQKEKMATSVCLYLGLTESPAKFGFKGENHWIFSTLDHDQNYESRNDWLQKDSLIKNVYISFPSLKDPEAKTHTADIISFTDYSLFEEWKAMPWKKRGENYIKLKESISNKILEPIEERYPGFRSIIDYIEVSTPLTNEHFTSQPDGAIYGLACTPERYDKEKTPWFDVKTPIEGLYLTGTDAGGSPGIAGAMMGGLACALKINGSRDLLKKVLN
jgi:all-trans-retinol 13,14-reductase